MEIDGIRPRYTPITPEERKHRFDNKLCLYCGKAGHVANDCRARTNKVQHLKAVTNNPTQSKNRQPQV
jgi:hypothetical protein